MKHLQHPVFRLTLLLMLALGMRPGQTTALRAVASPAYAPVPIEPKVLEIIFNPVIESAGNQKLTQLQGWSDPATLDAQYIVDVGYVSHDFVHYTLHQRIEVDDIPQKADSFDYSDDSYLACIQTPQTCHMPDTVDYGKIFADYDICSKVLNEGVSEVWLWGGPYFGYFEWNIRGPLLNASVENIPLCGNKTVYVMGFNYERGSTEMLHDLGHRAEGVLAFEIAGNNWQQNEDNDWNKFSLVASPISSFSYGHCGNMHFPPNGTSDYDYTNPRVVQSDCADWYNYPNLSGTFVALDCTPWNCDEYTYHRWWLHHLPHADGVKDGHLNDWWRYVVDYDQATTPPIPSVLISSDENGRVPGLNFRDEDIFAYDPATGLWHMVFDGSDVGLGNVDLDGFAFRANGHLLLSVDKDFNLRGFGAVDDADILEFIPSSYGNTTSGSYLIYFDGSDVGLNTHDEDVDAIDLDASGNLLVSVAGAFSAQGVQGNDEDLFALSGFTPGANTSGTWSFYFAGSDVGLTASGEDLFGLWADHANSKLYLTTHDNFAVPGVSGAEDDIFVCSYTALGVNTACTFSVFWNGDNVGFSQGAIDGLAIGDPPTLVTVAENSGSSALDDTVEYAGDDANEPDPLDGAESDGEATQNNRIFLPLVER